MPGEPKPGGLRSALFVLIPLLILPGGVGCHKSPNGSPPPQPPPADPSNLTAPLITTARIDLAWTDNSTDEDGFRVERSPNGTTWTEIAILGPNVTTYSDLGLTPQTTYFYRVRAYNAAGFSAYAGPIFPMTLALGWTAPTTAGGPPAPRSEHSAIYDGANQRMIVFGGNTTPGRVNELWDLSLPAAGSLVWNQLTLAGPPSPRSAHSAIYDSANQRMIVFGGSVAGGPTNEVWELTLGGSPTWTLLTPTGGPVPARFDHAAIYDRANQRMIVFGGNSGTTELNDVWAMTLPATGNPNWSPIAPSGTPPIPRESHTSVYDSTLGQMVVFGGLDNDLADGSPFNNGTWTLGLPATGIGAWNQPMPPGPPTPRSGHTAIYDSANRRMAVFSGDDTSIPPTSEAWALNLFGTPAWVQLLSSGTSPAGRLGHTAIYDSANRRMIVFGGDDGSFTFTFFNDVWALGM